MASENTQPTPQPFSSENNPLPDTLSVFMEKLREAFCETTGLDWGVPGARWWGVPREKEIPSPRIFFAGSRAPFARGVSAVPPPRWDRLPPSRERNSLPGPRSYRAQPCDVFRLPVARVEEGQAIGMRADDFAELLGVRVEFRVPEKRADVRACSLSSVSSQTRQ